MNQNDNIKVDHSCSITNGLKTSERSGSAEDKKCKNDGAGKHQIGKGKDATNVALLQCFNLDQVWCFLCR